MRIRSQFLPILFPQISLSLTNWRSLTLRRTCLKSVEALYDCLVFCQDKSIQFRGTKIVNTTNIPTVMDHKKDYNTYKIMTGLIFYKTIIDNNLYTINAALIIPDCFSSRIDRRTKEVIRPVYVWLRAIWRNRRKQPAAPARRTESSATEQRHRCPLRG